MKPLRSSTIKEVSETVECDNGNDYTRTEKWKFFMRDYVYKYTMTSDGTWHRNHY